MKKFEIWAVKDKSFIDVVFGQFIQLHNLSDSDIVVIEHTENIGKRMTVQKAKELFESYKTPKVNLVAIKVSLKDYYSVAPLVFLTTKEQMSEVGQEIFFVNFWTGNCKLYSNHLSLPDLQKDSKLIVEVKHQTFNFDEL